MRQRRPTRIVELDLDAAIRTAVDLASPGAERSGIALAVDLPKGLPARADPDALAQVLGNLLQNAIRYTPAGGRVVGPGGAPIARRRWCR